VDVAIVVQTLSGDFFSTRPLLWKIRRQIDDRIEPVLKIPNVPTVMNRRVSLPNKLWTYAPEGVDMGELKPFKIVPFCPQVLNTYRPHGQTQTFY